MNELASSSINAADLLGSLFTFEGIGELLALPFVQSALIACAVLGLVAGALAPLIVSRGMAFAVHGTAELAFTGGAAALLIGIGVGVGAVAGAVVAGLVFGLLGLRQRERDSVIGVVLAFGLGLGVLMLALYSGRASNKFGLLTGSIVSVDSTNIAVLAVVAVLVIVTLAVLYRPLLFASTDPDVALARGVPVRFLSLVFAVLIGLTTALAVPIVGAILVLSVMIAPGAAAARVTANPLLATVLAVLFAELSLVGGTVLSLAPGLPVSGYVATIAFLLYVGCRLVGRVRSRRVAAA
ncbi:metal ABC transporter permease [Pseudonocardia nigra]|uniref:metal ABC transporter permease n=1 Tax=Pseudonocardia nigra TaxID=1921578 RepID=UPI001C5CCA2D|nr:metal ABC transporter permease [Pseudonocardia nigra]